LKLAAVESKPDGRAARLLDMGREVSVAKGRSRAAGAAETVASAGARPATSASLARLYETHAPAAYRLAYLLTGEPDLAEDLVQDAFVRIIGRFGQLRSPEAFDAYLRRTVVNLSYGVFRRRRVERAFLATEAGHAATAPAGALPDVEASDELWRQLRRVAPRQRAVLVLRYYEDLSEHQTADMLGCSVRTVKSLTARGLAAMRSQRGDT
jgi:RNA polymerase sigma-70 factor (sigma-E family)